MSPRKVRFVLDTVRGKYAPEALAQLQFTPNFAAAEIAKVIKSACANAQNNFDMDPDALKIVRCYVDGGPVLKRVQPRAQGRAYRILKRTSHITVVVEDVERPVPPAKGVAKPVGRRQPLLAPSVLAATGGAANGAAAGSVPAADETLPQPVDTVEETAMNAGAPGTEEVAATPTEGRHRRRRFGRRARSPRPKRMWPRRRLTRLRQQATRAANKPRARKQRETRQNMGQKIHPIGFRIGVIRDADSKWFADKEYAQFILEDHNIRGMVKKRRGWDNAAINKVEIERPGNTVRVTLHTAKPGVIIGRGGAGVDQFKADLEKLTKKPVHINVQEIRNLETHAQLVAEGIAQQIEKRIGYKRAMRQAVTRAMKLGVKGIRCHVAGRLGGSEMARREQDRQGKIPLHTLRADIDYGFAEAATQYGHIGVKVWIYKGDILPGARRPVETPAEPRRAAAGGDPRGRGGDYGRGRRGEGRDGDSRSRRGGRGRGGASGGGDSRQSYGGQRPQGGGERGPGPGGTHGGGSDAGATGSGGQ
jgi:small subunit ribosomal protein S3